MTKLKKKEASFKISFDKPELVSMKSQNDLDFLKISFPQELLDELVDSESGQTVELVNNFPTFYKMLPPQMPSNEKTVQLKNSTKTATQAVLGIIVLQFMLAYFTSYSLNALWGMMNGLSFIVYLPMINLTFPSNFYLFNKYVIEIATFDIVPKID